MKETIHSKWGNLTKTNIRILIENEYHKIQQINALNTPRM